MANDIKKFPLYISNSLSFPEFSRVTKFPDISRFSRLVSSKHPEEEKHTKTNAQHDNEYNAAHHRIIYSFNKRLTDHNQDITHHGRPTH